MLRICTCSIYREPDEVGIIGKVLFACYCFTCMHLRAIVGLLLFGDPSVHINTIWLETGCWVPVVVMVMVTW